ncbi:MAG TPA: alpha/beta hydrolase [Burkholderiales bacterium]|nr:alpha/beta hydrolase [Burkholderiales bacterium]
MSEYLPAVEIETRPKPSHAVIWLHGLGADGNDFVPIVDALALPPLGIRFVFPHAPLRPITINGGFVMRGWYDITGAELSSGEDEHGIRSSQKAIEALIARESGRGIPTSRMVLAGFSQGGAIALQTGLRQKKKLAGLLILSAYLPLAHKLAGEREAANDLTPIYMAHGREDGIVPPALARQSKQQLEELGYTVQWREYDMPHAVCEEELEDIGDWLGKTLL